MLVCLSFSFASHVFAEAAPCYGYQDSNYREDYEWRVVINGQRLKLGGFGSCSAMVLDLKSRADSGQCAVDWGAMYDSLTGFYASCRNLIQTIIKKESQARKDATALDNLKKKLDKAKAENKKLKEALQKCNGKRPTVLGSDDSPSIEDDSNTSAK